jgi:ABC-type branched-subunit amino acid transport system substrate-binding protein
MPPVSLDTWATPENALELDESDVIDYLYEVAYDLDEREVVRVLDRLKDYVPDGPITFREWIDRTIQNVRENSMNEKGN